MAKVRLPYYRVKRNGRGFWEPTVKMKRFGFEGVPCGPDGPNAWRIALRSYRRQQDFPFISVNWGAEIPKTTLLRRKSHPVSSLSNIEETDAAVWLDVSRGRRAPAVFEQVYQQQEGYALVLLTIEQEEDDDEEDDSRWNRRNFAR